MVGITLQGVGEKGQMDDKLMMYLLGQGIQPTALDRLIQKMDQTRGGQPLFSTAPKGYRGNTAALEGKKPMPPMYKGVGNARV